MTHFIHLRSWFLWRGSLLPLGREAAPLLSEDNGTAAQSSGSKLPRHRYSLNDKTRIRLIAGTAKCLHKVWNTII
ncbi:hypothetical protein EIY72_11505 [Pseudomonas vancouverensis]|uniref:Uncharacterized protein n=1 Tax=Pseudomonas vancouverensis TaxID=95300 RepID=A0A4R4KE47_PSEVA|nr:hypothetical protein F7R09_10930 [Pseudomonas vancouverensis]TDB65032.1 hypothetical protein EIY72_11505 [Pseudomonas vancouverensis]